MKRVGSPCPSCSWSPGDRHGHRLFQCKPEGYSHTDPQKEMCDVGARALSFDLDCLDLSLGSATFLTVALGKVVCVSFLIYNMEIMVSDARDCVRGQCLQHIASDPQALWYYCFSLISSHCYCGLRDS